MPSQTPIFSPAHVVERLRAAKGVAMVGHLAWSIAWLERRLRTNFDMGASEADLVVQELEKARARAVRSLPPRLTAVEIERGFAATIAAIHHARSSYLFADDDEKSAHLERRARLRIFRNELDNLWLLTSLAAAQASRRERVIEAMAAAGEPFLPLPAAPFSLSVFA